MNLLQIISTVFDLILSHWLFFLVVVVLVAVAAILELFAGPKPTEYQYKLKALIMSHSEFEFFKILLAALQNRYDVFPQIHLDAILDNKIKGQSWFGAFRHINEKSVDFLLCDKKSGKPILAIELDDRSHEREDRIVRDREVERMLNNVGLPLLRVKNNHLFSTEEVTKMIADAFEEGRPSGAKLN